MNEFDDLELRNGENNGFIEELRDEVGAVFPNLVMTAAPEPSPLKTGILDDAAQLRAHLDQFQGEAGRWNISAAYRALVDTGRINIGRRAFALRVKRMFPEA